MITEDGKIAMSLDDIYRGALKTHGLTMTMMRLPVFNLAPTNILRGQLVCPHQKAALSIGGTRFRSARRSVPLHAELELRAFGREHFLRFFVNGKLLSLSLQMFVDAF